MNPLRWDVLLVGFVLALPVFALGLRGDLTAEEVTTRLLWCLAAGWVTVALLRWASRPRDVDPTTRPVTVPLDPPAQEEEHSPAS